MIEDLAPADISLVVDWVVGDQTFAAYRIAPDGLSERLSRGVADPRHRLLVCRRQQVLCGFAWVVLDGAFDRCGYLRLIVVAPTARGQGVGGELLSAAERLAGVGLMLLVNQCNQLGQRFYHREGFRQVGAISDFVVVGQTECIFFKPTPSAD